MDFKVQHVTGPCLHTRYMNITYKNFCTFTWESIDCIHVATLWQLFIGISVTSIFISNQYILTFVICEIC